MRNRLRRIWLSVLGREPEHKSCRWVLESALQQRDAARLLRDELARERKRIIEEVESLSRRVSKLEADHALESQRPH